MNEFNGRTKWWVIGGAAVAVVLVTLNVLKDLGEADTTVIELVIDSFEILLMMTGATGVGLLIDRTHYEHREKLVLIKNLAIARSEGASWRSKVQAHIAGIGAEMERQFEDWALTSAEREVALLMLKGFSHKEIAAFRGTTEGTVRQQARSVYQKSSLPSKTAFSAYFLEDLLPPTEAVRESPSIQSEAYAHEISSADLPEAHFAMRRASQTKG